MPMVDMTDTVTPYREYMSGHVLQGLEADPTQLEPGLGLATPFLDFTPVGKAITAGKGLISAATPFAVGAAKKVAKPIKDVFHVTFADKVPGIREKGLRQFQTSNWVKAGTPGVRYNEDAGLFAWENSKDALYWAKKMEFEFPGKDISILRVRGGKHWGDDPADVIGFQRATEGKALRSMENIPGEDVVKEFTVSQVPGAGKMGITFEEWVERISKMLDWTD